MKKVILLGLVSILAFNSCKNDDVEVPVLSVVGTWKLDKTVIRSGTDSSVILGTLNYNDCKKQSSYDFSSDGNYTTKFYDAVSGTCAVSYPGTQTYKFNSYSMRVILGTTYAKVYSLTENELVIQDLYSATDYNNDGIVDIYVNYMIK